jgi:hypothetical protein
MFIKVQNSQNDGSYNIKVSEDEKISAIKIRIGKIDGMDPEEIMLTFVDFMRFRHLDDERKISDYKNIKEGSNIYVGYNDFPTIELK